MKKITKILSLLMALVLALSLFTGCATTGEDGMPEDEQLEPISLTIGIPVSPSDANWADWEAVLASWVEDFNMFYSVKLNFTKVPTEGDALKKFMKKVRNGKVACFFSSRQEFIETLIEKDDLTKLEDFQFKFTTLLEETPKGILALSEENSLNNYMIPFFGTFQGLYYNRTLFKSLELENPNSWENILAAVEVLKKEGITPIAAGFADEGLEYMIDEIILSEGGVAEHSYQPTFGVVSSWERAVKDIKTLEEAGAFTADCYNVNFADAVQSFLNGDAAMIVAPSTAFGGQLSQEDVKAIGFPVTPTGKREEGAIVGRIDQGLYISNNYFMKNDTRYSEALYELTTSDYFGSADFYELFADESTFHVDKNYYSDFGDSHYEDSLNAITSNMTAADWPMRDRALTMDTTVECFRKALTGGDVDEALQTAADAEIAAAEALEEEEED